MSFLLPLLLASAALAGPGSHANDPGETNPNPLDEAVALRFDWPVGLTCAGVARVERSGFGPAGDRVYVVSETLKVDAHAEGRVVRQEGVQVEVLSPRTVGPGADPQAAVALLAARAPDRVIAADGSFRRLDRLEEFRAAARADWERWMVPVPEAARERLTATLDTLLDGRALQRTWSQRWDTSYGFWAGRSLPVGATAMAITTDASPLLPDAPLDWQYTFSIAERGGCLDADCVRLVYDGRPGRDALLAALGAHGRSLLGPGVPSEAAITWSAPSLTVHAEMVADPATLIPRSFTREARLYAEARWDGDKVAFVEVTERRQSTSTCLLP